MALLMIGSLAFAQRGNDYKSKGDRKERNDRNEMMAGRLELTDEQQVKLEDLRIAHLKNTSAIRSELKVKKAELDAAITAEKTDSKQVDKLVDAINSLQGKLFAEKVSHRMEVRSALDDKQKLMFDQMKDHRFGRNHRGKRG